MDKEFEYGLQDEGMTVNLLLDDDTDIDCSIIAIFPVLDKDYIALYPMDDALG